MNECILLTGATGFLGSYLLKRLINEDYNVIVLKRSFSNTFRIKDCLESLKYYDIDRVDPAYIFEVNKIDTIIHCATNYGRKTHNPLEIIEANLILPLKLIHSGLNRNLKTFINTDTLIDKRINDYSLSKKQFLEWLKVYSNDIKCINISLEHFYGYKDDNTKFVTGVINDIISNVEEINLTKGDQKRDFIYIDDVIEGFIKIIENIDSYQENFIPFEIGTGKNISIKDFVQLIKLLAENTETKLNFGAIPYRPNEIMESKVDISKLKSLGWQVRTKLEDGLKKTIELEKRRVLV